MKAMCHEIYFLSGHELCCTASIFLYMKCDDYRRSDLNMVGLRGRVSTAVIEGRRTCVCLAWVVRKKKANFVTAALLKTRDQSDESVSMSTLVYTLRTGSGLSEQTSIRLNLEKCQVPQVSGWNNFYYLFLKRNVPRKLRHEQHKKKRGKWKRANSGRGFLSKSGPNWWM